MKRNKANHLDPYSHMKVMPIPFSVTGKEMIEHLREIADSKRIVIDKQKHDETFVSDENRLC